MTELEKIKNKLEEAKRQGEETVTFSIVDLERFLLEEGIWKECLYKEIIYLRKRDSMLEQYNEEYKKRIYELTKELVAYERKEKEVEP